MAKPWKRIDRFTTGDDRLVELRQRGERDFQIYMDGRILMNSMAQRSEIALGRLACRALRDHPAPRVLVGGLGMGFTLRAVLDSLPSTARIVVAELHPEIVGWCQGPLSDLTAGAVLDSRVAIEVGDVCDLIRSAATGRKRSRFHAIVLDLYHGPNADRGMEHDPVFGRRAISRTYSALESGGIFAVWGEGRDAGFCRRLSACGFAVHCRHPGRGGFRYTVFLATQRSRL